jgi:excisionase family DNA binding protein
MDVAAVTIAETAKAANLGHSTIYEEIRRGNLKAFKIGRSTRIRVEDLRLWLDSRPALKPRKNLRHR